MEIKDGSIQIPIDQLTVTIRTGGYSIYVTNVSIEADITDSIRSEAEGEILLSFEGKTYEKNTPWEQELCDDIKRDFGIYNVDFDYEE